METSPFWRVSVEVELNLTHQLGFSGNYHKDRELAENIVEDYLSRNSPHELSPIKKIYVVDSEENDE
jgi:hypothetical protein